MTTKTKPWALPTPSRTFSPAPVLPGALPPDPHTRRCRQQPEHQKMSRLRRILYVSCMSRVVPLSLPRLRLVSICSLFPLTIFDFFRDRKTEGKPGLLTCHNGQVKSPNPPERKEKKKKITRIQYLCGFPGFLDVVIRHS